MGKVVDITDKLKFEENPALVINGKKYEVNAECDNHDRSSGRAW